MKNLILALAAAASLGISAAQAQSSSTYERSCFTDRSGAYRCTSTSESEDSFSVMECSHRGDETKCETKNRDRRIPEPTIEHVQRGGKTINVMRGMPR